MLSVLRRHKQHRIIVISETTLHSMSDENYEIKMQWESNNILLLRLNAAVSQNNTSPHCRTALNVNDMDCADAFDETTSSTVSIHEVAAQNAVVTAPTEDDPEWEADVKFLRYLFRRESAAGGSMLKSMLGNLCRSTNPTRFPNRDSVKKFLAKVIAKGATQRP